MPGHVIAPDGLPARVIQPHSREKAHDVYRYADIVSTGMKRYAPWWVELLSGPGVLYDERADEFIDGSPLDVLGVPTPFAGYSFGDLSQTFTDALRSRVGDRPDVVIESGNANDLAHVERLVQAIPPTSLVIAYLDPEGLELDFSTIRALAERFKRIDFLLNFPVNNAWRELCRDPKSPRVSAMLDHPNPVDLAKTDRSPHAAIRAQLREKFEELGFRAPIGSQIRSEGRAVPQYDLLLCSRNPKADELYRKAGQIRPSGQGRFEFSV